MRGVYGDEAGRAIGLWTAFTTVATIAGPPVGGALVEWVSWRWIFFINLPLAAFTVVLAKAGECDEQKMLRVGRLDIPGATLAALAFGTLTYGLVEAPDKGFGEVWWAFAISVPALVAFCLVEARSKNAMLPFDLFKRRNFAMANLETFLVYGALYAQLDLRTALPAVHRLLALRGRAPRHPREPDHDRPRGTLRKARR